MLLCRCHLRLFLVTCCCVVPQSINRHTREDMKYTGVFDAVKRMLADEVSKQERKGSYELQPFAEICSEDGVMVPLWQTRAR
jgi:hypothetical protein